jgi:hypothetical protein
MYVTVLCRGCLYTQVSGIAQGKQLSISCPAGTVVSLIEFASFGTPVGSCAAYPVKTTLAQ